MVDRNLSQSIDKQYDTSRYEGKYDDVKRMFDGFDPSGINDACNTWSGVARLLGDMANTMHGSAGQPLSDAWESDASTQAQHHLSVAQATAQALADQCMQMARATDTAYQYANWYKTHLPGTGLVTMHDDHQRAVEHMTNLLTRYNEVIGILPPQVQATITDSKTKNGQDDFTKTGGSGGGGGGGGAIPGGHGGLPGGGLHPPGGGTGLPGGGGHPGGGLPGGGLPGGGPGGTGGGHVPPFSGSPYDPSSSLAGGGGGGGLGSGLGPGGGGVGGGAGIGGGAPGGLGSGPGGVGAGGFGPGGAGSGAGAGAGRGALGAGGSGAGAGGRGAMGGAPMHGSHGDGDDDDRERSTWLTEDEDVWGGDTDAAPPVIGG